MTGTFKIHSLTRVNVYGKCIRSNQDPEYCLRVALEIMSTSRYIYRYLFTDYQVLEGGLPEPKHVDYCTKLVVLARRVDVNVFGLRTAVEQFLTVIHKPDNKDHATIINRLNLASHLDPIVRSDYVFIKRHHLDYLYCPVKSNSTEEQRDALCDELVRYIRQMYSTIELCQFGVYVEKFSCFNDCLPNKKE